MGTKTSSNDLIKLRTSANISRTELANRLFGPVNASIIERIEEGDVPASLFIKVKWFFLCASSSNNILLSQYSNKAIYVFVKIVCESKVYILAGLYLLLSIMGHVLI